MAVLGQIDPADTIGLSARAAENRRRRVAAEDATRAASPADGQANFFTDFNRARSTAAAEGYNAQWQPFFQALRENHVTGLKGGTAPGPNVSAAPSQTRRVPSGIAGNPAWWSQGLSAALPEQLPPSLRALQSAVLPRRG